MARAIVEENKSLHVICLASETHPEHMSNSTTIKTSSPGNLPNGRLIRHHLTESYIPWLSLNAIVPLMSIKVLS